MKPQSPYEIGTQKNIPAVLLYARDARGRVLMIYKENLGKWNGLGGKLEVAESYRSAARREFQEEAGVDVVDTRWEWLGVLLFPNFKPARKEDWTVQVFSTRLSDAEASGVKPSEEGRLEWVVPERVMELPLWDGDREFMPWVLRRERFEGTLWYEDGCCKRFALRPITPLE